MTKPILTNLSLSPINLQDYERYLPSAFDSSLSILQKVNLVIDFMNRLGESNNEILDNWNQLVDWIENGSITDDVLVKLNEWLEDGTLNNLAIGRFTPVGTNAIATIDSMYVPNDANLFGYKADGTHVNIGTVQQNDILQYGDINSSTQWFISNNYQSLRAPNSPSYQKIDSEGNSVEPGRTFKHQGNSSNHLRVFSVGDHDLQTDIYTDLHTLTNVQGQFPPDSYNNFAYTIPREGMYTFSLQLKIKTPPIAKGYIRVAISKLSGGVETLSEIADLFYDPTAYGTPFLHTKFDWKFEKDDLATIKVKPLNEDIIITEGTRLHLYGLGDTIQS